MATTVYPVLCATDVGASAAFYREFFDFDVTFDSDWYVSLRHPDGAELAILDSTHPTIPEGYRERARGVLVNVEVDDVDAVAARLEAAGVTVVQELRDEAFGQRHVIVRDPGDVLVDVITEIEPSAEFLAAFGSTD
ncbi:VOC family protein [Agromyces atrinae]|uniref:Glyoxalase n=1 Tax=Agromyces atrinae TaxID=592376 RepID=A0A4Q2MBT3_9MICO|nr:VOC family protein [Agromyces atrinae]NYD66819.1 putative glyoxalase superfamily protein PhnB [Agromyces atrinae]RXZ87472.1 glyoxalase [Agromyces atrinae]